MKLEAFQKGVLVGIDLGGKHRAMKEAAYLFEDRLGAAWHGEPVVNEGDS